MTTTARGVGGSGAAAPAAVGGNPYTFTFVDGTTDDGELQTAVDAVPDFVELLINTAGAYILTKPLRLTTSVGLSGLGQPTYLLKDPFWFAGPTILTGPIQDAHPHGDPILDDADFSYVFHQGAGTEMDPTYWMPIGMNGCYPRNWTALNLQLPMVINAADVFGTFFSIHGETNTPSSTNFILDMSWKFTLDHIIVTIWTSAAGIQLESTTDFSADLGTRHMVEVDWNGTTAKLLVDGVVEATAALGGTFGNNGQHATLGTYANQTATIGGRWIQFGQTTWDNVAEFDLGGFFLGNASKHQANYTVDWNIPAGAALADVFCMVQCTDDHEEDDLIKLVAASNGGYSWMQTRRLPAATPAAGDVTVRKLKLGASGVAGGVSIEVFSTTRARVEDITSLEQALACYGNNIFYGVYRDIFGTGGQRMGSLLSGGIISHEGLMKFSGADIGCAFVSGGGGMSQVHTFDYSEIGCWLDSWTGSIKSLLLSDESTGPGVDPIHGVQYYGSEGISSCLNIENLDINVISSDVTIPFCVVRNRDGNLKIRGAAPFLSGATTPPAHFFVFKNPTLTDPIQVDMVMTNDVPIASHPQKILTPSGPAGRATLTNADASLNPRTAREFDRAGVTLTSNRSDTLVAELDTGIPVTDGTVVEVVANQTFDGNTQTVKNHDASSLHVFSAAGSRRFRFSRTTGNWSRIEAA